MDIKARSKAMREVLTRIVERARGAIEVKVFGDKVIMDDGTAIVSIYFYISITDF
jgi:inositol hexakisphosphate/diphosphoinositol-pentakisphosphate kinase